MICLDLSNHDESTFDAACFKSAGVTDVIMGCQLSGIPARRMIPKLQEVNINVRGTYAFLGFNNWWIQPTRDAINVAKAFNIPMVWLDAEGDDVVTGHIVPGVTPGMRIARLHECVDLVQLAGLAVGIYTGGWFWPPYMNNTTEFSHLPLWHSAYPTNGQPITEVAYGGWEKVSIHQYTSSYTVCNRNRDANYIFEEEDDMTEEQKAKLDAVYNALCAGNQAMIDAWNANGNNLLLGYSLEQEKLGKVITKIGGID